MRRSPIARLTKVIKAIDESLPEPEAGPTWNETKEKVAEQHDDSMHTFHAREAEKYDAKARDLAAAGKTGAAARAAKVAERNRRLADKHRGD